MEMSKTVPDGLIVYTGATSAASESAATRLTSDAIQFTFVLRNAPTIINTYYPIAKQHLSRFVASLLEMGADIKLAVLAERYRAGTIDIPELTARLGAGWTIPGVVAALERLGVSRAMRAAPLSGNKIDVIMARLACISSDHADHIYDTPEWIEREVVASQRIEGIYVDSL